MNSTYVSRLELHDLDWFIELSGLIGYKQYSFSSIRARQDAALTERLRQQALERIGDPKQIEVTDDNYFLGSVDYMARRTQNGQLANNAGDQRGQQPWSDLAGPGRCGTVDERLRRDVAFCGR